MGEEMNTQPKKKVMVVEDEESVRELMCDIYVTGGYDVEAAANGLEGLKLYEKFQPDIVITDIKMPEMDGITMARELRKTYPKVKVIFVTGWFQEEAISKQLNIELRQCPKYRLIQKPFKIETVWRMTDEYLEEQM